MGEHANSALFRLQSRGGAWRYYVSLDHHNAARTLGRHRIATLAEADGEHVFAREVRQGMWDHRADVANAIRQAEVTSA